MTERRSEPPDPDPSRDAGPDSAAPIPALITQSALIMQSVLIMQSAAIKDGAEPSATSQPPAGSTSEPAHSWSPAAADPEDWASSAVGDDERHLRERPPHWE